jgi:hypothetical protein
MTYNFDPERWYANQRAALEARHEAGDITDADLERLLEDLETRLEEMETRLDGTFEIPTKEQS